MLLSIESKDFHGFIFLFLAQQPHAIRVKRISVSPWEVQRFLYYGIRFGLASHRFQDRGFGEKRPHGR